MGSGTAAGERRPAAEAVDDLRSPRLPRQQHPVAHHHAVAAAGVPVELRGELRAFLSGSFAKWWLPDAFEFVDEIPKTAVGKFRKTALREQFVKQPAPAK